MFATGVDGGRPLGANRKLRLIGIVEIDFHRILTLGGACGRLLKFRNVVAWEKLAPTARCILYRIEALLQDKTSMITASTATNRRRSTPLGSIEAALSRAMTEPSAQACERSEPAASEAVTSWAGSARKPSRARVSSLPGSP